MSSVRLFCGYDATRCHCFDLDFFNSLVQFHISSYIIFTILVILLL